MGIKIITDSGCDLPEDLIEKHDITVLPIFVLRGEEEYRDKIDIYPEEVLKGMEEGTVYKTSQTTPEVFLKEFEKHLENEDKIICLPLSKELSGTYQSAVMARKIALEKYPDGEIYVQDINAVSGGEGLIVLETANMVAEGMEISSVLNGIKKLTENIEHIFTIGDIKYLYRGGRISKVENLLGGILSIKPILNVREGKLEPLEKVRGKNKAFKAIINIMKKRAKNDSLKNQTIIITHGNDSESAKKLKRLIEDEFEVKKIIISSIGAVIGAHAGLGTLAIFFLKENYK